MSAHINEDKAKSAAKIAKKIEANRAIVSRETTADDKTIWSAKNYLSIHDKEYEGYGVPQGVWNKGTVQMSQKDQKKRHRAKMAARMAARIQENRAIVSGAQEASEERKRVAENHLSIHDPDCEAYKLRMVNVRLKKNRKALAKGVKEQLTRSHPKKKKSKQSNPQELCQEEPLSQEPSSQGPPPLEQQSTEPRLPDLHQSVPELGHSQPQASAGERKKQKDLRRKVHKDRKREKDLQERAQPLQTSQSNVFPETDPLSFSAFIERGAIFSGIPGLMSPTFEEPVIHESIQETSHTKQPVRRAAQRAMKRISHQAKQVTPIDDSRDKSYTEADFERDLVAPDILCMSAQDHRVNSTTANKSVFHGWVGDTLLAHLEAHPSPRKEKSSQSFGNNLAVSSRQHPDQVDGSVPSVMGNGNYNRMPHKGAKDVNESDSIQAQSKTPWKEYVPDEQNLHAKKSRDLLTGSPVLGPRPLFPVLGHEQAPTITSNTFQGLQQSERAYNPMVSPFAPPPSTQPFASADHQISPFVDSARTHVDDRIAALGNGIPWMSAIRNQQQYPLQSPLYPVNMHSSPLPHHIRRHELGMVNLTLNSGTPQNDQMMEDVGGQFESSTVQSPEDIPQPTSEYLQQASMPIELSPEPRKLLLVLDLNGTLLARRPISLNFKPRPALNDFFIYGFKQHKVMIWTSARPHNMHALCMKILTKRRHQACIAQWGRDKLKLSQDQYHQKARVYKRLETIWNDATIQSSHPNIARGERWDQTNTVLIDDSMDKAVTEPYNHICVPEMTWADPEPIGPGAILTQVSDYLEKARRWNDVSSYIREHPFKLNTTDTEQTQNVREQSLPIEEPTISSATNKNTIADSWKNFSDSLQAEAKENTRAARNEYEKRLANPSEPIVASPIIYKETYRRTGPGNTPGNRTLHSVKQTTHRIGFTGNDSVANAAVPGPGADLKLPGDHINAMVVDGTNHNFPDAASKPDNNTQYSDLSRHSAGYSQTAKNLANQTTTRMHQSSVNRTTDHGDINDVSKRLEQTRLNAQEVVEKQASPHPNAQEPFRTLSSAPNKTSNPRSSDSSLPPPFQLPGLFELAPVARPASTPTHQIQTTNSDNVLLNGHQDTGKASSENGNTPHRNDQTSNEN